MPLLSLQQRQEITNHLFHTRPSHMPSTSILRFQLAKLHTCNRSSFPHILLLLGYNHYIGGFYASHQIRSTLCIDSNRPMETIHMLQNHTVTWINVLQISRIVILVGLCVVVGGGFGFSVLLGGTYTPDCVLGMTYISGCVVGAGVPPTEATKSKNHDMQSCRNCRLWLYLFIFMR